MMTRILAAVALLGLGGCDMIPMPDMSWNTLGLNSRQAEAPAASNDPINAHCQAVAEQRMRDGAYNSLDEATQQAVYNGTYSDCVKYEEAHGPG